MPIYEFVCEKCRRTWELMQRMSDPPPTHCPHCNGSPVTKLISRTSFQLKGSGWYATDYKPVPASSAAEDSKTKETASGEAASSQPKVASTTEPKTHSKTEAKAPPKVESKKDVSKEPSKKTQISKGSDVSKTSDNT